MEMVVREERGSFEETTNAQSHHFILVLYDAQAETAYWMYVQSYFQPRPEFGLDLIGETLTVYLNLSDIVNTEAIRQFAHYKERSLNRLRGVVHDEE